MSSEGQAEKRKLSLAKAFEALQAGPIYQVRVSPPPAVKPQAMASSAVTTKKNAQSQSSKPAADAAAAGSSKGDRVSESRCCAMPLSLCCFTCGWNWFVILILVALCLV